MIFYQVLIVGDSRTRHLEVFLNNNTMNIRYTVITIPGASLHRIGTIAVNVLHERNFFHLTIIAGGTNDLSMLRYIPMRHARPRFNDVDTLVAHTTGEMRRCINYVSRHSYTPVALATLSGINLSQYVPQLHDFLFTYQPIIDQAIIEINRQILSWMSIEITVSCCTATVPLSGTNCSPNILYMIWLVAWRQSHHPELFLSITYFIYCKFVPCIFT